MIPKQHEMDGIVQVIYEAIESKEHLKSTLFVLCGDHGMNDAGNHGASSPGETSPALVFISPKLGDISKGYTAPAEFREDFDYYSKIEQSDIAPTIAGLLGFPVSKNNLGAFIPEFLPFWAKASDQVQVLFRNGKQILDIVTATFGKDLFDANKKPDPCTLDNTDVNELACQWREISQRATALAATDEVDQEWLSTTSAWLRRAQDLMSSMASNYDMTKLILGQGLIMLAVVISVSVAGTQGTRGQGNAIPLVLITITYGIMMFASSYVEEEHHFWYWSTTLWIAWLGARQMYRYVDSHLNRGNGLTSNGRTKQVSSLMPNLLALTALRLMRGWNQTGQKFAGEPDIVKIFINPSPSLLWTLVGAMYILITFQMLLNQQNLPFGIVMHIVAVVLVASAFSFKLAFTAEDAPELVTGFAKLLNETSPELTLLSRARIVFALLSLLAGFAVYQSLIKGGCATMSSSESKFGYDCKCCFV
jgi:ethanolaminephosphotransferase